MSSWGLFCEKDTLKSVVAHAVFCVGREVK